MFKDATPTLDKKGNFIPGKIAREAIKLYIAHMKYRNSCKKNITLRIIFKSACPIQRKYNQ